MRRAGLNTVREIVPEDERAVVTFSFGLCLIPSLSLALTREAVSVALLLIEPFEENSTFALSTLSASSTPPPDSFELFDVCLVSFECQKTLINRLFKTASVHL